MTAVTSPPADFFQRTQSPGATANELRARFAVAWVSTVHMKLGTSFDSLAALAGGSSQALTNAQANAIRAAIVEHMAAVGTAQADGEHKAADTANSATLAAIPAAATLGTCITLVNGIKTACAAHGAQSGKHFNNDATLAAVAITPDPPTTLPHCVTALNTLLAALQAHTALYSA